MSINKFTPFSILVIAGVVAVTSFAASLAFVINQPWLGLRLLPSANGLLVQGVEEPGPSAGVIFAGDTLKALMDREGNAIRLLAEDIVEDPDELPSYAEYNDFLQRQDLLARVLLRGSVTLLMEDGRIVRIQPEGTRSLSSLPLGFWLHHMFAIVALAISAGIWTAKRDTVATWFLFISGVGLFVAASFSSLYISRELALPAELMGPFSSLNSISNRIFCIFALGLLWYYPKPLHVFSLFTPVAIVETMYVVNELFQWLKPPLHAFYLDLPLLAIVSVLFGVWRWKQSRGDILEKAIVKWFLLSIFISVGPVIVVFVLPIMLGRQPLLSVGGSYMILLIMYIGLAMGVFRYRLFDIDYWWREMWLWLFSGLAIVVLDIALIMFAGLTSSYALMISIAVAAWFYFPLRQWLWGKLFHYPQRSLELYVPLLLRNFMRSEQINVKELWNKVLNEVFKPLSVELKQMSVGEARLVADGIRMQLPGLSAGESVELNYAEKGRRLFNNEDTELAQLLYSIVCSSVEQREFYMKGVIDERKRVMRDLHDDVGGRLLTLTHSKNGDSSTAAEALKSLREIIYALDVEQHVTLDEAAAKWRIEALERCELANKDFKWVWDGPKDDIELSPREALNLTLVLREALSNVFVHARAASVQFRLYVDAGGLHVLIRNDSLRWLAREIKPGKGLRNMDARIKELGGTFEYEAGKRGFRVQFDIPLAGGTGHA